MDTSPSSQWVQKRKLKDESQCQPITLLMREYYGNKTYRNALEKRKERYKNDPEYRKMVRHRSLLAYHQNRLKKLQEECKEVEVNTNSA